MANLFGRKGLKLLQIVREGAKEYASINGIGKKFDSDRELVSMQVYGEISRVFPVRHKYRERAFKIFQRIREKEVERKAVKDALDRYVENYWEVDDEGKIEVDKGAEVIIIEVFGKDKSKLRLYLDYYESQKILMKPAN